MKYLARFTIALLLLLPFISVFLWAGFDWTWWTPTGADKDRQAGLFVLHLLAIILTSIVGAGWVVITLSEDEKK